MSIHHGKIRAALMVTRMLIVLGTATAAAQPAAFARDGLTTVGFEITVTTSTARALDQGRETFLVAGEALAAERDRAVRALEVTLREMRPELEEIKASAAAAGAAARKRLEAGYRKFAREHEDLATRVEELRTTSSLAWQDLIRGTEEAAEKLRHAVGRARERF